MDTRACDSYNKILQLKTLHKQQLHATKITAEDTKITADLEDYEVHILQRSRRLAGQGKGREEIELAKREEMSKRSMKVKEI